MEPTVTVTSPTEGAIFLLGQSVTPAATCTDEEGGSGVASCDIGTVDTSSVGAKTFTVVATDNVGNRTQVTRSYEVVYDWTGFLGPVDNLPTVNSIKAGSAVPVKFALAGNQGLAVLANGSPTSAVVPCTSSDPVDAIEQTVNAGSSSLSYDAGTGQYTYVWKTDKAWAGTCRQLVVKLADGTEHRAMFNLTR